MKLKKTLKYIFSFLLVLCMMCGLVGNYVPGGTVEAEGVASSYTVTLNGRSGSSHFWMYNATASDGPITLKYTVNELSSDSIGTNGVVANQTTSPYKEWPSSYGSFYKALKPTGAEKTPNIFMKVGCTYTLTIGKNASGVITFAGGYVDEKGTYNSLDNPISDWADWSQSGAMGYENTSYKHFGVFFSSSVTGTLTNVTCVDASGNDLGITSNQSGSYAIGVQKEAESLMPTSYVVNLRGCSESHFWMYNKTASAGPITLSYTVEELSSGNIGRNGVVANLTTSPQKLWPCDYGSHYRTAKNASTNTHTNHFMKVGCTYTLTIGKDANGALTFAGGYKDAEGAYHPLDNPISDWADWSLSGTMGPKNKSYEHFGVHMTSSVTGTLTNVTCTDASGKDLGITSNQSGSYAIGVTEEKNPMVQEFTATQFATYRSANKTYPTAPDGYVFSGWYSDKTCTTALKADAIESTATAYAKYVDADVLSVKYQLPANVSSSDESTTLRLVTTVDSLQYSFVGFQIYMGDDFIGAYKTKDVYDKITGTTDSTTVTYKPYVFSSESEYFMAVEITGVPSEVFSQTITVIPAWETLDGTVVMATGNARQDIVIANAIATLEQ